MITYPHESVTVASGNVRLHVVCAGPDDGPLVILLHGFPEFWYGWRAQIPALADAGYHVYAPDQRGYNLSDKPHGLDAYTLDRLTDDVLALLDHAGRDRALLVGHDWGANVAWWFAAKHPQRLHALAILNAPHPIVMGRALRRNRAQLRRSWYMFAFQLPWLPERILGARGSARGLRIFAESGKPGMFSAETHHHYREAMSRPGAWTGMLNWYRAVMRRRPQRLPDIHIHVPTLILWGLQDVAFEPELAEASLELCTQGDLILLEDATHWVQHDEPEKVNAVLLAHCRRHAPPGGER